MRVAITENGQEIAEVNLGKAVGFWRRQFGSEPTRKQRIFDWLFGVILPVICAVADPFVFNGIGTGKGALLGDYKPFFYLLSFAGIIAMMTWLMWGKKLGWLNALFAGLFIFGGIASLAVGVILLPFSLFGLIILIGALGFTPLFSAFVYLRNGVRAIGIAKPHLGLSQLLGGIILSALISFTVPMLFNIKATQAVEVMKNGDVETIERMTSRMKYIAPFVNFDRLAGNECKNPKGERQKAFETAYQELTGRDMKRIDMGICYDW